MTCRWITPLLLVVAVSGCADSTTTPSSAGGASAAPPTTVATRWSGTSERTEVTGGECAGDLLRTSATQTVNREATVSQTGTELAVVFNSRLASDPGDTRWRGSVDRAGHIALTWYAPSAILTFICRNGAVRRVEMTAAAASLTLSADGQDLSGTMTMTYEVRASASADGAVLGTMTEITREVLRRVAP